MLRVTKPCAAATFAFAVLCAVAVPTAAFNVLAIEPLPAWSHWTFMRAVLRALATGGRGHNVTAYTPFASSSAATAGVCDGGPIGCGYVEIPLQLGVPDKVALDVRTAVADFADPWRFVGIAVNKSRTACDRLDRMAAAGHFSGVRYDVVVVELISSECTSRVSGVLGDVPLVYVFPSPMASWVEAKALGTSPGPSYAARLFAQYATPDTLARRLENAYGWTVMAALQWFHEQDDDTAGNRKPAVTFVNTDPTVEKPVPAVQNMIGIGGVHLPPPRPIPSVQLSLAGSDVVVLAGAHALMRGDDPVKPAIVAGGSIKGLCVSRNIDFLFDDRDLNSAIPVPALPSLRLNVRLCLYMVYAHYRYTLAAAAAEQRPYDLAPPVKPSLVFVNTHYVTEPSRPVSVNRVDVGGIHLTATQPLPADILKFIEESSNGVIFFTFGSVVALSTLPDHIQNTFKNALAEVPQRVLLKYEGEMKDKPENVMTSKWLPQRDILIHPNVKLFIGHGGISGVYEAVDAGVPILGFPLFYDQPRNMANLVDAGMALSLDLFSVTKYTLLNAINEIITNETYSKNAKITSELFKDRPMSPAESVVYWTEYVIRHKGAPHLRSHALNLTWYQYFLLDVIAAVLLFIVSVCYIAFKTLQLIKKTIYKSSTKLKSKSD